MLVKELSISFLSEGRGMLDVGTVVAMVSVKENGSTKKPVYIRGIDAAKLYVTVEELLNASGSPIIDFGKDEKNEL